MVDTHLALAVVCNIPAGQNYSSSYPAIFKGVQAGTPDCLYYGLAESGHKVLIREGYKDAAALLQHTKEVPPELAELITNIGPEKVKIMCTGSEAELAKVRPTLEGGLPIVFVNLDPGSMKLSTFPSRCPDTHITVLAQFEFPQDKVDQFENMFPKFYQTTKTGAGSAGCLYYGFGISGCTVYLRKGFTDAEAAFLHDEDVQDLREYQWIKKIVMEQAPEGYKMNVVGPKAELEKMKRKQSYQGATFWELDSGSFWM